MDDRSHASLSIASEDSALRKSRMLRRSIDAFSSNLGSDLDSSQRSELKANSAVRSSAPAGDHVGSSDLNGSSRSRRRVGSRQASSGGMRRSLTVGSLFDSDPSMKEDPLLHAETRDASFWKQLNHNAVKGGAERTADENYTLFVRDTYIFEPRSPQLLVWLVFVLIVTLYASIETPVEIAWFSATSQFTTSEYFLCSNVIVTAVFMIDIFVTFNTAFVDYAGGRGLVSSRAAIVFQYAKLWLWIDLLATIPFDVMFMGSSNAQLLRLLKMLRLLRIFKLMLSKRLLRAIEGTYSVDYDGVNLALFLFLVLLVMHIMGCCLFIVSAFYGGKGVFLSENGIAGESVAAQYIYGMYWAAMTVSTIGYGDVAITSNSLRVYAIACMLIGASFYAYIVGSLVQIIMNMDQRENERRQALAAANAMTSEAGLPRESRRRIRAFFSKTAIGTGNGVSLKEHQECIGRMSPPMAAAFARHVLKDWLPYVMWLQSEDNNYIVDFTALLGEQSFAPREPVIQSGAVASIMYIIRGGSVVLVGPGYVFANHRGVGEEILLAGRRSYGYDCYSSTYLDCWTLDRDAFHDLVERYPKMLPRVRWAALAVVVRRRDGRVTLKAAAEKSPFVAAVDVAVTETCHRSEKDESNGNDNRGVTTFAPAASSSLAAKASAANGEVKEARDLGDGGTAAATGTGSSGSESVELATALQGVLRRSLQEIEALLDRDRDRSSGGA